MIYSDGCDQPMLLAVLLHIKAADCLAHSSTASNLKSYILCSSSIAVIYHTHLALTHCYTQPVVRQAEPSMPLLLILAFCQQMA